MAKGARSKVKKALRTAKRAKIGETWVADAEQKRMEALAKCLAAEPVAVVNQGAEDKMEDEEERSRSRPPRQKSESAAMDTDGQPKKRGKGFKVKGVQKKTHNKKKVSPLWVNQFDKSKKSKRGKQGKL